MIDDGSELSFYLDAPAARSAMQGLASFDSNEDGLVSVLDKRFGEFKILVDTNHDGRSDAGELRTLADHGVVSINLRATASQGVNKVGRNVLLSTAVFNLANGSTGTLGDVALGFKPSRKPVQTAEIAGLRDGWRGDAFRKLEGESAETGYPIGKWLSNRLPEPVGVAPDVRQSDSIMAGNGMSDVIADDSEASRARLLAVMMQDMAAFGPGAGLEDQLCNRHQVHAHAEIYS